MILCMPIILILIDESSGIVLYAPALALSAVTGLHFEGAVIGIGDYIMMMMITTTTTTRKLSTKMKIGCQ